MYNILYGRYLIFTLKGKATHRNYDISAFRKNLKTFLDKVLHDHSPLFVTRANAGGVVVMSKAEYESMQETFYLLKSPKNAERLLKGLEEYEQGR